MVLDQYGDTSPLNLSTVRRQLLDVVREPDGSMRATASRYVDGEPVGPFRYYGTRTDDPNDVIDHEQRRELRGLRLFAAWLNHDDQRS